MNNFLRTGLYTEGCIVPVTTEDPSLVAVLDDFCDYFRVNIYVGKSYIDSVTMDNYRSMCSDVSGLIVTDRRGNYINNIWTLIQEQMFYDYLRIHSN